MKSTLVGKRTCCLEKTGLVSFPTWIIGMETPFSAEEPEKRKRTEEDEQITNHDGSETAPVAQFEQIPPIMMEYQQQPRGDQAQTGMFGQFNGLSPGLMHDLQSIFAAEFGDSRFPLFSGFANRPYQKRRRITPTLPVPAISQGFACHQSL